MIDMSRICLPACLFILKGLCDHLVYVWLPVCLSLNLPECSLVVHLVYLEVITCAYLCEQHLGCVVPDCVELQEMICESCMNKNPFLWTYAAHLTGNPSCSC